MDVVQTDGVLIRRTVYDGDSAHGLLTMNPAIRQAVLEQNQRLRNEPEAIRKLDSMGWAMCIPVEDYYNLKMLNPDLSAPDGKVRTAAWKKFLGSAESLPYRVTRK